MIAFLSEYFLSSLKNKAKGYSQLDTLNKQKRALVINFIKSAMALNSYQVNSNAQLVLHQLAIQSKQVLNQQHKGVSMLTQLFLSPEFINNQQSQLPTQMQNIDSSYGGSKETREPLPNNDFVNIIANHSHVNT